jgi:iron only hydrogenase large subunit-like protein
LRKDAVELLRAAEKNSAAKERELEEEIRPTMEKDGYDMTISQLNEEKRCEEHELTRQRRALLNAEYDLHGAQSLLAHEEADLRLARATGAGESTTVAVTMGAMFGLAGAITSGFGGDGAAALKLAELALTIREIERRVDMAKSSVGSRESDVSRAQSAISSTQKSLSDIQNRISDYNARIHRLSEIEPTLAVHRQAVELWKLFVQGSENTAGTMKCLGEILQKANAKQIAQSSGSVTIAKSFVEAWEEISFNEGRIISK